MLGLIHLNTHSQQNTTVDCTTGPVSTTFCYDTGMDNSYTFTSNDGTPLNLTIAEGQVETNWDELEIRDSDGTVLYNGYGNCLLYTSPSPRDAHESRMPSSA